MGFDAAYVCGHTGDYRNLDGWWLDVGARTGPAAPAADHRGRPVPTVLRVAARLADCWNTHGPFGRGADEIAGITEAQNRRPDELCADQGRPPASVRRSVLLCWALDAWASSGAFTALVERFRHAGVHELVVMWPDDDRRSLLDQAAARLASLR